MMSNDLIIKGDPQILEWIAKRVESELSREVALERITSTHEDEFREPIAIGLIVALGGPAVVAGIVSIIDRALEHQETIRCLDVADRQNERTYRLDVLRLALLEDDDTETAISLKALRSKGA